MDNNCSTDETYLLFSVVSSFMKCPHVQHTIPVLQCVKHALHCDFGSTVIISHNSVFPEAIIAFFDSQLQGLNARCCEDHFEVFLVEGDSRFAESNSEY